MLVSYQWLNQYVDIAEITAKELGDKLSVTGIEVEGIENAATGLKKIVVGHVLTCVPHPDSDHLNICTVEVEPGVVNQIVCGAPNVAAGQKVIVALPGARIADNVKIKKGKMRGVESLGMICSLQELGISENVVPKEVANGIFILPADAPVGADLLDYLTLNDDILELSITPNRADALSMIGAAYEVGAVYGKEVTVPTPVVKEDAAPAAAKISAHVAENSGALSYHLRVVEGVTIAPSPLWLQMLLIKEGIRPINNVVDVTNYVLLEYGQPMHAFDYDALGSKEILVRRAQAAEKLTTLDGEEHTLDPADIVITNGTVPAALGGVMGGLDSEITATTQTVVLEAAAFDGLSIRLTGKRHNLRSESSARFEKGINMGSILQALDRAANLVQELAGGKILSGVVTAIHTEPVLPEVAVTLSQINGYLGTALTVPMVTAIFAQLNFPTAVAGEKFTVTVPSRRWDIAIAADLIEEVARIYGYDKLPTTLPKGETTLGVLTDSQRFTRALRQSLNGAGLQENISYALVTEKEALEFAFEKTNVTRLMWPMSEDHAVLRQNLISGLLTNISFNLARKSANIAVYEIGRVFMQTGNPEKELPQEKERLAIAITGDFPTSNWQEKATAADFYTVKGLLERLLAEFGIKDATLVAKTAIDALHPGRSGEIYLGDDLAGIIGQVHPQLAGTLDLTPTYVLELDLATLFAHVTAITYAPVSKFPAVKRDQAILVKEHITNADVVATMQAAGGKFLQDVTIFDVYQGQGIASGEKSLAYTLTFANAAETLTDEQITAAITKIQTALVEKLGAILR